MYLNIKEGEEFKVDEFLSNINYLLLFSFRICFFVV